MQENQIRQILEQADPKGEMSASTAEEIIAALKGIQGSPESNKKTPVLTEEMLREEMRNETDWRKRASIAARIISLNLE